MFTQRQLDAVRSNLRKRRPGFTADGITKLRQAALRHKPWRYSTGPRTVEGKAKSRENAVTHGTLAVTVQPFASANQVLRYQWNKLLLRSAAYQAAQRLCEAAGNRDLDAIARHLAEWNSIEDQLDDLVPIKDFDLEAASRTLVNRRKGPLAINPFYQGRWLLIRRTVELVFGTMDGRWHAWKRPKYFPSDKISF